MYNALEIVGCIAGLVGVWLAAKANWWNWPVGIIGVTAYAFVFFKNQLYADMALQWIYVVMGFYGWFTWKRGIKNDKLEIRNCEFRSTIYVLIISLVVFFTLVFLLQQTDSSTPCVDAFTSTFSLAANWMMTKKWIQHWLVWIVVDLVSIGMYVHKMLYPTAVLYFIFTALAVYGYIVWKKQLKQQLA